VTSYDLHQHLWPERFVAALRSRVGPPLLEDDELVTREGRFPARIERNDPESRVRELDRDGIDVAVLSLQATLGLERLSADERAALEGAWAEGVAELAATAGGRFAWISPGRLRPGAVGVSVGATELLDPDALAPVLGEAEAEGRFVFVHPDAGEPPAPPFPPWWGWVTGYAARMQEAYLLWLAEGRARWPELRVLFAMLAGGAPFQLERLAHQGVDVRSTLDANLFLDVATYGRRAIELCIETFGVGQLVYGSDTPVLDPSTTLHAVRRFGESVVEIIQTETPRALLR